MSPKRKGGAAAKPPAQPKPAATTAKPPPTTTAPPARSVQAPSAGPAAGSSTQRISPTPHVGSSRPGVTMQANPVAPPPRTLAQPPRATAQPAKSASAPQFRNAAATAPKPAPAQKRTITRSDRVRAEWHDFELSWVAPNQRQIEKELGELFKAAADLTSRNKGKAQAGGTPPGMDKIVTGMQRDFALAARAEWEHRLERAGLQAEDWTDMTLEEMQAVEQVLAYEESDEEPGVFAQVQHTSIATTPNSGSTAVAETTPPAAARSLGGWKTSTAAAQPTAAQKTNASPAVPNFQPAASRRAPVTEAREKPKDTTPSWSSKSAPIVEDSQVQTQPAKAISAPSAQLPQTADLLVYAVPISLTQPPLDPALAGNKEYVDIVEKLHINSIRQFHMKAADADAELARQLRKPMTAGDRAWTIRAHQVAMEQLAREIVTRRNQLLDDERKKRGLGGAGGDSAPPSMVQSAPPPRSVQPPGAFPEERPRPAKQPEPEPEPLLEYTPDAEPEPEPEPDVDEVIEIPIKGKGKKKGKKVVETKPTTNGRSTPTSAPTTSAARAATPVQKTAPTVESKGKAAAPTIAAWNAARTAAPPRAASPALINTKHAASVSANGRSSPAPVASSSSTLTPWEAAQAKATALSSSSASAANGMWAPPVARTTSNTKNPFAPARPSRLAQVTKVHDPEPVPHSPESPEPPSPPPQEPSGRDYVAWFAGSSSEDEGSITSGALDEDEDDEDDEDEEQGTGSSGIGGLLASLAGASPWALFGEGAQPQRAARAASPARGRGTTPTPARAAAARFAPNPAIESEPAYARWGMPSAGPSAPPGPWKEDDGDDLERMLEIASSALGNAATGSGRPGGVDIEQAMGMYVTAAKARETLATPVGGRSAWRR